MGGGDLNLKKSWHPSTLRNIERVWKAEQKHEVEKQKIEQLQRELAEERAREEIQAYAEDQGVVKKREERLDWMYQGPAAMVDRDEYLLGRKIDKTFELLQQQETGKTQEKDELDIGATMFSSQNLSGTATVDLANKIREDPLFSIMKKEKEQRKNLLNNPVKMKQLQQMLQESLGKRKNKLKKKHSDSDSVEKKHHKKHKRDKYHKSSSSESDDERVFNKGKSQDFYAKEKKKSSSKDKHERKSSYYNGNTYNKDNHISDSRDNGNYYSSKHKNSDYNSRHRSGTLEYNSKSAHYYRERISDEAPKKKLDAEERDRRLKEMQDNAKWRDDQRERNFRRYKEEDEREERAHKGHASDFIKPLLSKAVEKGTVENRVKQKIFSIQRTSADMQKHFMKR